MSMRNILTGIALAVAVVMTGACSTARVADDRSPIEQRLDRRWIALTAADFQMPATTAYDYDPALKKFFLDGYQLGIKRGLEQQGLAELSPDIYDNISGLSSEAQSAFIDGWYGGVEKTAEQARIMREAILDEMMQEDIATAPAAAEAEPRLKDPVEADRKARTQRDRRAEQAERKARRAEKKAAREAARQPAEPAAAPVDSSDPYAPVGW